MVHGENTCCRDVQARACVGALALTLKPLCTYRDYHSQSRGGWPLAVTQVTGGCEIRAFDGAVPYRIVADKGALQREPELVLEFPPRAESARGLDDREDLFVPGEFAVELAAGETVTLILSAAAQPSTPCELA